MPDNIKEYFELDVKSGGLFKDEAEFRSYIADEKNAKEYFDLDVKGDGMFKDYDDFKDYLGLKKKPDSELSSGGLANPFGGGSEKTSGTNPFPFNNIPKPSQHLLTPSNRDIIDLKIGEEVKPLVPVEVKPDKGVKTSYPKLKPYQTLKGEVMPTLEAAPLEVQKKEKAVTVAEQLAIKRQPLLDKVTELIKDQADYLNPDGTIKTISETREVTEYDEFHRPIGTTTQLKGDVQYPVFDLIDKEAKRLGYSVDDAQAVKATIATLYSPRSLKIEKERKRLEQLPENRDQLKKALNGKVLPDELPDVSKKIAGMERDFKATEKFITDKEGQEYIAKATEINDEFIGIQDEFKVKFDTISSEAKSLQDSLVALQADIKKQIAQGGLSQADGQAIFAQEQNKVNLQMALLNKDQQATLQSYEETQKQYKERLKGQQTAFMSKTIRSLNELEIQYKKSYEKAIASTNYTDVEKEIIKRYYTSISKRASDNTELDAAREYDKLSSWDQFFKSFSKGGVQLGSSMAGYLGWVANGTGLFGGEEFSRQMATNSAYREAQDVLPNITLTGDFYDELNLSTRLIASVVPSLPMMMATMIPSVGIGVLAKSVSATYKLTKGATQLVGVIAGGVSNHIFENLVLESGSQYLKAINEGKTPDQASAEAWKRFGANTPSLFLSMLEVAPFIKALKPLSAAALSIGAEGFQEVTQGFAEQVASGESEYSLGNFINYTNSAQAKEEFLLGVVMGAGQGAAAISTTVKESLQNSYLNKKINDLIIFGNPSRAEAAIEALYMNGVISEKEYNKHIKTAAEYKEVNGQIPDGINNDQRVQIADKLIQAKQLDVKIKEAKESGAAVEIIENYEGQLKDIRKDISAIMKNEFPAILLYADDKTPIILTEADFKGLVQSPKFTKAILDGDYRITVINNPQVQAQVDEIAQEQINTENTTDNGRTTTQDTQGDVGNGTGNLEATLPRTEAVEGTTQNTGSDQSTNSPIGSTTTGNQTVSNEIIVQNETVADSSILKSNKIEGKLLNEQESADLQKEIEDNYTPEGVMRFGQENTDIRSNIHNYDNPIAEKDVNGVNLRITEGLIEGEKHSGKRRKTYLLYADGKVAGKFYSVEDIKKVVKFIEDNLIKSIGVSNEATPKKIEKSQNDKEIELLEKLTEKASDKFKEVYDEKDFNNLQKLSRKIAADIYDNYLKENNIPKDERRYINEGDLGMIERLATRIISAADKKYAPVRGRMSLEDATPNKVEEQPTTKEETLTEQVENFGTPKEDVATGNQTVSNETVTPEREGVENTTKALKKLPEDVGYEIEGMANGYIQDVASKKLNDIIEETDLPDNIKAVIRKRFSLNSKGEYSSSIPFDRIVKSGDIQFTKKFIKDVGAEILRDKYGENSNEYSRELEKLNSSVDNYIQSLLDAEESGKPVKTNPEIAKVANVLTGIQDKFNEADKNTPKTTAEAYHYAKSKGIENDFTKAVEQSTTQNKVEEQPTEKVESLTIEEVENNLNQETDMLLGGQAEKNRQEGSHKKDGIVHVRNEKQEGIKGNKGNVRFASDVQVPFTYKLVEAETLQPSHQNGARNPKHFIPEAQPKNRNDVSSIQAEDGFADNPRFEELGENTNAYSGAPTVNERNEVVQGNNRAAGFKKGYKRKGYKYKQDLAANAEKFGFTKEQVEGMENPVLVREVQVSDQGAIELGNYDVKDLETGGKRRIDPVATTRRIPFEVKGRIASLLFKGDGATLNASIRKNVGQIMNMIGSYINQSQRNSMLKDGNLTDAGAKDLEAIVQYFLFDNGDVALPELYENLSHTQKEGLRISIPYIFSVRFDKSILKEIQNAIIALSDFENSATRDMGDWSVQRDMFGGGKSPIEIYTPLELKLAQILLDSKTQKEIRDFFSNYATSANDKPSDMFSEATEGKAKKQAVEETFKIKYDERRTETKDQTGENTADDKKGIDKTNPITDPIVQEVTEQTDQSEKVKEQNTKRAEGFGYRGVEQAVNSVNKATGKSYTFEEFNLIPDAEIREAAEKSQTVEGNQEPEYLRQVLSQNKVQFTENYAEELGGKEAAEKYWEDARANNKKKKGRWSKYSRITRATDRKVNNLLDKLQDAFPEIRLIVNRAALQNAINNPKAKLAVTSQGVVYGAVVDGVVYLDDIVFLELDVPIHEFGHLWLDIAKQKFPEFYKNFIRSLEGTAYFAEAQALYPNLSKAEQLEEAAAQAIADAGVKIINRSALAKFKAFFKELGVRIAKALGIKRDINFLESKWSDFANMVAQDLLAGRTIAWATSDDIANIENNTYQIGIEGGVLYTPKSGIDSFVYNKSGGKFSSVISLFQQVFRVGGRYKEITKLNLSRTRNIESLHRQIAGTVNKWRSDLKKYSKGKTEQQINDAIDSVNDFLVHLAPLSNVPKSLRQVAQKMRDEVDGMSNLLLQSGFIDPNSELYASISANLGIYMNRAYAAHLDPDWNKRMFPVGVKGFGSRQAEFEARYKAAFDYIKKQLDNHVTIFGNHMTFNTDGRGNITELFDENGNQSFVQAEIDEAQREFDKKEKATEDEVNQILQGIAGVNKDKFNAGGGKMGKINLDMFKKKNLSLPEEIRAFLGEYTNPDSKYISSMKKMAEFMENKKFLIHLKNMGLNRIFFDKKGGVGEFNILIADESTDEYSPMNGLYTSPEILAVITEVKQVRSTLSKIIALLNVSTKIGKTALSIKSQERNFLSNFGISAANGYIANMYIFKNYAGGFKEAARELLGRGGVNLQRLAELGIINTDESARFLEDQIKVLFKDDTTLPIKFRKTVWEKLASGAESTARNTLKGATKLYMAGDNVHKVANFLAEMTHVQFMFPHKSLAEQERIAMERYEMVNINYDKVPLFVQWLRRIPIIAPFPTFHAEILRISFNIPMLALRDINQGTKTKNSKQVAIGLNRLISFAVIAGGTQFLATALSKLWSGLTDDDEEIMNFNSPDYAKNNDRLVVKIEQSDGTLVYSFADLSWQNPFGWAKKAYNAFERTPDEAGMATASLNAMEEMFKPFISDEITVAAWEDIVANDDGTTREIYNKEDDPLRQMSDKWGYFFGKTIVPSVVKEVKDVYKGAVGRVEGKRQYDLSTELKSLATGSKVYKTDVIANLPRIAQKYADYFDQDYRIFGKVYSNKSNDPDRPKEVIEAYERANRAYRKRQTELIEYVALLRKKGFTDDVLREKMKSLEYPYNKGRIQKILDGELVDIKTDEVIDSELATMRANLIEEGTIKATKELED